MLIDKAKPAKSVYDLDTDFVEWIFKHILVVQAHIKLVICRICSYSIIGINEG